MANWEHMRQLLVFDPSYLPTLESKLFFEGPLKARKTLNFAVLLGLATMIAIYGVLPDSTATVVGAMIVAPLMTPIMATAAALTRWNLSAAARTNIPRCARRDASALEQLGRCDQAHQPAGNGAP